MTFILALLRSRAASDVRRCQAFVAAGLPASRWQLPFSTPKELNKTSLWAKWTPTGVCVRDVHTKRMYNRVKGSVCVCVCVCVHVTGEILIQEVLLRHQWGFPQLTAMCSENNSYVGLLPEWFNELDGLLTKSLWAVFPKSIVKLKVYLMFVSTSWIFRQKVYGWSFICTLLN